MKIKFFKKGVALIEVIISMAIMASIISVLVSMVLGSLVTVTSGEDRLEAENLATEGIEAVRSIRDRAWNENIYNQSAVSVGAGQWNFNGEGTTETIGKYVRTISFADVCRDAFYDITICPGSFVDPHTKKVVVVISWTSRVGNPTTLTKETYITDWRSAKWNQTDWIGGAGQNIWANATMYDSDDGNVNTAVAGQVSLSSVGVSCGTKDWTFTTPTNYTYNSGEIEVVGGNAQLVYGSPANWWDTNYLYRQKITINNNDTATLPAGYSVPVSVDHYAKVLAGKSLANGDDVRIVYWNGSANVELDRVNETVWNTNGTNADLWIATQSTISASGSDNNYYIYYGNNTAVNPPANKSNVYLFFDDFESGNLNNWTAYPSGWTNPSVVGTAGTADKGQDVFVVGNKAYFASKNPSPEFTVFDITDPANPTSLGTINIGDDVARVYVQGNYAYLAVKQGNPPAALTIVDVTNPATMSIVGTYNLPKDAKSIYVNGNYAYVGTKKNNAGPEFYIFDITNPATPTIVGSYALTANKDVLEVVVKGNYAYLGTKDSNAELIVLDVSTPATPTLAGSYNALGNNRGLSIAIENNDLYLGVRQSNDPEIYVLDITTPATPTLLSSLDLPQDVEDISIPTGSDYAFAVSAANPAFHVIDKTNTSAITLLASTNLADNANGIKVINDIAYVATDDPGAEFKILKPEIFWNISTVQSNSGNNSLTPNAVNLADRWIRVNGINESDVLMEAYWRFSNQNNVDLIQGLRNGTGGILNEYEAELEYNTGWNISKTINGFWSEIYPNQGNPQNNTWTKITSMIDGTFMRVLKDGVQITPPTGTTNVGTELTTGSVAFDVYDVPNPDTVWFDDVKVRKYTDPEPTTLLSAEQDQSPTYPTNNPAIFPNSSYTPVSADVWSGFTEVAVKNGGEVYYQLSDDNGATWYYWDGAAWSVAGVGNYNTATVINANIKLFTTTNNSISFRSFLQSNGTQQVQIDKVSVSCSNFQMEVGTVSVADTFTTVNLSNTYSSPVIVASYQESANTFAASVRIDNITPNSFDVKLQNPAGGALSSDLVTYFVVEEGLWDMNGTIIEAGKITSNKVSRKGAMGNFDTLTYTGGFASPPIVLHQVMTNNDPNWITSRVSRNNANNQPPNLNGFRISMMAAEDTASYNHGAEDIGWIAIDANVAGLFNAIPYETKAIADGFVRGHNNGCYNTNYANTYTANPLVLGFQQEVDGGDGGWSVTCNNTTTQVGVHVEEDQVSDTERSHTTEAYSFLAFATPFSYSTVGVTGGSTSWPFTTASNYTYNSADIEVLNGTSHLVGTGSPVSGSSTNSGFNSSLTGWTANQWGDPVGKGKYKNNGGNPGGYARLELKKNNKNKSGGEYFEQPITITANSITSATLDLDWWVERYRGNPPISFNMYAFVDTFSGAPTIGTQVWASGDPGGTTNWASAPQIDVSSIITTPGTYYIKIAAWADYPNDNNAEYRAAYDNVILNWSGMNNSYPTTGPAISATTSFTQAGVTTWTGFSETATKNGGEIYYQLSDDDGVNWYYWNGSAWVVAGANNYNTATVVDANINNFPAINDKLMFKAFLVSDGTQYIELDDITVNYSYYAGGGGGGSYAVQGSLTSSAFDTATNSNYGVIEWVEDLTGCTGCDVSLQVRTAPDNAGAPGLWSSWYGLSGVGTYFTSPEGGLIPSILNGNPWVQYRFILTGDGTSTPIIKDVTIYYQ